MGRQSIYTYTGEELNPLAEGIHPAKFKLLDIAHSLALQCRYTGHTRQFYSVAQHCSMMALWAEEDGIDKRTCASILMHDAAEAYLTDLARPLKDLDGFGELYREAENRLLNQIFRAFGLLNNHETWSVIKHYDDLALVTEQHQVMHSIVLKDGPWYDIPPRDEEIPYAMPGQARTIFLTLCRYYGVQERIHA